MKYENIIAGRFKERPNRFVAYARMQGREDLEAVHVKNTGRCAELLMPDAEIFVQERADSQRKTKWDLIAVMKGNTLINMDSQAPNKVVHEWLIKETFFNKISLIKPERTYKNSRFDFYVEADGKQIFIEVKGVTLEKDGAVSFPDAPSDRAVKHLQELIEAAREGYEAHVFFVIQMKGVRYFTPNADIHPAFAETLQKARSAGVKIMAFDCLVTPDSLELHEPVPVVLASPRLKEAVEPLLNWYRKNRRELPWREDISAYRVWVSEVMLQQTRAQAVIPYYERFLKALPDIRALAEAEEDRLLKLWEGLGYYNRVRNMQKAARQIMADYGGEFPHTYEDIRSLSGIGDYMAGAIGSFVFGIPKPAVDGNVLRVAARLLASYDDIMKASVRSKIGTAVEAVIPADDAADFNQGLIELGATVCVPNGEPRCEICPLSNLCKAKENGIERELPVRAKAKARRIEKRTILVFQDINTVALRKRPAKGLLAGLYELPNVSGHLTLDEVIDYSKSIGLAPIRVHKLDSAKHIFSHVEWQMIGYEVVVDALEEKCSEAMIFAEKAAIVEQYPIPTAFEEFMKRI